MSNDKRVTGGTRTPLQDAQLKHVQKEAQGQVKEEEKQEGLWDRFVDWTGLSEWLDGGKVNGKKKEFEEKRGSVVDGSAVGLGARDARLGGIEVVKKKELSFDDKEYKLASMYVNRKREQIEKDIIEKREKVFNAVWERMFKKINDELLAGKSYEDVKKKYGQKWVANFSIAFDTVFNYAKPKAGKALDVAELKLRQGEAAFVAKLEESRKTGFYEEFIFFFNGRLDKERNQNEEFRKSEQIIDDTKKAENERYTRKIRAVFRDIEDKGGLKIDLDDSLKLRYEKILNEAKVQDYSGDEIDIAQIVVNKYLEAFEKRFKEEGIEVDMDLWRLLVSKEPMLAKAEILLFQKYYDVLGPELNRRRLLLEKEDKELTPEELVMREKELSYPQKIWDTVSLFCKMMRPSNRLEGPESLRAEGNLVRMQALPIQEVSDRAAWLVRYVGGKKAGDSFDFYANELNERGMWGMFSTLVRTQVGEGAGNVLDFGAQKASEYADFCREKINAGFTKAVATYTEIAEKQVDRYGNEVEWRKGKNRYLLSDLTIEAKDGMVARGIKSLMKGIVGEPESIKSQKFVPWLAKYGKAAVMGVGVAVASDLVSFQMPTMGTVVKGIVGGLFWERYKEQIKTAVACAIPGAIAAIGMVVAVGGVGALAGTGGIFIVGLAAVLFALFGVWVLYRTKMGADIREKVANFVYSEEIAWFKQWNERIERADLGRRCFNEAVRKAEARRGQIYLRTELARDQRYKNLEAVCDEEGLSSKAKDAFLEQVRRNPKVLSQPEALNYLVKSSVPAPLMKELNQDKMSSIISKYHAMSKDILMVGLERRYQNLKNALNERTRVVSKARGAPTSEPDSRLPGIIEELERMGEADFLRDDDRLKKMLLSRGVSQAAINRVFARGSKKAEEKQVAEKVGWGEYLTAWVPFGKKTEVSKTAAETMEMEFAAVARDKALVEAVLILREIVRQRDVLADEQAFRALLKGLGFNQSDIDGLVQVYDESDLTIEKEEGVKGSLAADKRAMEEYLLRYDILMEAQFNRYYVEKSDADLLNLTDDELAEIEAEFKDDNKVLQLLNKDQDIDIPIMPSDRALMYRFGMQKMGVNGKVLRVNELSDKDRKRFLEKKQQLQQQYGDNFEKLRIGLKRDKLIQARKDEIIKQKQDAYVAKILANMSPEDKQKRIEKEGLEVLEGYMVRTKPLKPLEESSVGL